MQPTDQDLLESLRSGDRRAFSALVTRWSPRVMELACRLLRDGDLAQDVHQQAFLRVWAGAATFEGRSRFSTWLHQVVVNLCRDLRRSDDSRRRAFEGFAAQTPERLAERPDMRADREELGRRVAAAIAELPEDERELILLKHYAGLTFRSVAKVLGIPASTAKSRFGRALDRLRATLKELEP